MIQFEIICFLKHLLLLWDHSDNIYIPTYAVKYIYIYGI